MALTTEQFQAWLNDPLAIKCILLEVQVYDGTQDKTLYLSNYNYATTSTDTPSNTTYLGILKTAVEFTETLSLDGSATLSYGDIGIDNTNGEYDTWLNYVWANRNINIYAGDISHARNDFTLIFSGVVAGISSSDYGSINIQLRDKLEKLNDAYSDQLLGAYGIKGDLNPNKDILIPITLGEAFNVTPLLADDSLLEYKVHNGPIEGIIEVRDNGVPVNFEANLDNGTFTLARQPIGTITCSVQGDKRDVNYSGQIVEYWTTNAARIVQKILLSNGFGLSDIDLDNFNIFAETHTQPVGIYLQDRQNIITVCNDLLSSIGAQLAVTRLGKFRILKVQIPQTTSSSVTIDENSIILDSLSISKITDVLAAVKLGYCYNYTIQDTLLTGLPEEHKELYVKEWLSKTAVNEENKTLYNLNAEPVQKNTLILSDLDGEVTAEANRLLQLYQVPRYVYRMTCLPSLIDVQLGDMVLLKHARFGLTTGKPGQVISASVNWDTGYITLEVLV